MLLRLQVKGFKNLADVDVRFGPLTCFVGRNGVGKSNVMDAIHFLSLLAEHPIQEAAGLVRRPAEGVFTARDLVLNGTDGQELIFIADMLVPRSVVDDFGRLGEATTTLLRYEVGLRYVERDAPRLELVREVLTHHRKGEAAARIGFRCSAEFQDSAVFGERRGGAFISTVDPQAEERVPKRRRRLETSVAQILLHQDGGSRGQPYPVGRSPKTVLCGTSSIEYPTVLAARQEMRSWRFLHLEPSSMRSADSFGVSPHVTDRGGHIAATLEHLIRQEAERLREKAGLDRIEERDPKTRSSPLDHAQARVLSEASNRVHQLDRQIQSLRVDRDEVRQQMSVQVQLKGSGQWLGPRGISDGTLRYLALTAMLMDRAQQGALCLEEPENGMHPSRIPALTQLLGDFAVNPDLEVSEDNPLRQVIINTHSPDVVKQLDDEQILFVEEMIGANGRTARVYPIQGTWRAGFDDSGVAVRALPTQKVLDFIGGAPLGEGWKVRQAELRFGTAS